LAVCSNVNAALTQQYCVNTFNYSPDASRCDEMSCDDDNDKVFSFLVFAFYVHLYSPIREKENIRTNELNNLSYKSILQHKLTDISSSYTTFVYNVNFFTFFHFLGNLDARNHKVKYRLTISPNIA